MMHYFNRLANIKHLLRECVGLGVVDLIDPFSINHESCPFSKKFDKRCSTCLKMMEEFDMENFLLQAINAKNAVCETTFARV